MNFAKLGVFIIILVLSIYLISLQDLHFLSNQSSPFKLILAVAAGLFYASFLTSPLAVLLFVMLSETTNIYLIAILAGLGAMLGDLIIVKIFRTVFKPFSFLVHLDLFKNLKKKLHSHNLHMISYLLGMIIVASPFPDELGLVLLGISKLSYFKLAILTFILNSIGILAILYTTRVL